MMDTPADEPLSVDEVLNYGFFAEVDLAALARGEIIIPEVGNYPARAHTEPEAEMEAIMTAGEETVKATAIAENEPVWDMVMAGGPPERRGDDPFRDPNMFDAGVPYRAGEDPLPEFNYTAEILWPGQSASPPAALISYTEIGRAHV